MRELHDPGATALPCDLARLEQSGRPLRAAALLAEASVTAREIGMKALLEKAEALRTSCGSESP